MRVLLEVLDQSDWDDDSKFTIHVDPSWMGDEIALRHKLSKAMSTALCHRRWRLYMRKKHGGAEEAVCDIALPLACHNFLKDAYAKFVLENRKVKVDTGHERAAQYASADPVLPLQLGDVDQHPVQFEFDRAAWAAQNDRFRFKAFTFLNGAPPVSLDPKLVCLHCACAFYRFRKWKNLSSGLAQKNGKLSSRQLLHGETLQGLGA